MNYQFTGIDKLCEVEGFKSTPYLCTSGIPTIGIGTTVYPNGRRVTLTDKSISKGEACVFANKYINILEEWLNKNLLYKPTQNQFNATIIFLYNTGLSHFNGIAPVQWNNTKTAILTGVNWVQTTKSVCNQGLLDNRRKIEAELYNRKD